MTDGYLMDANCIHDVVWWQCEVCMTLDAQAVVALEWCLAGWMTVGVGVGYQDLANVYEALTGHPPDVWVRSDAE